MNPQFPIYIPSKSRWQLSRRLTVRALEKIRVPYRLVVEEQQYDFYASEVDRNKILILDPEYQRAYDPCDDLGDSKSKGSGPARNFIWDHAVSEGHQWHWIIDDNIREFLRLNNNMEHVVGDGTIFHCMEDFMLRYENLVMGGPQYESFIPRKTKRPPFTLNTRVFSCILIRNDIPFRWRGRYNEDLDLSLRILKHGYCTVLFNAFLQQKIATQRLKGGNTDEVYANGTLDKSQMIVDLHPDVATMVERWNRPHHLVNYRPFKINRLRKRKDVRIGEGVNDYGMALKAVPNIVRLPSGRTRPQVPS